MDVGIVYVYHTDMRNLELSERMFMIATINVTCNGLAIQRYDFPLTYGLDVLYYG